MTASRAARKDYFKSVNAERACLKVAAEQVGRECGFVEVGNSKSEVRPGWASRIPRASVTENVTVERVRVRTGWQQDPEIKPAFYTVLDNREAVLNTVNG